MSYISRDHVEQALSSMRRFHTDLQCLHQNYGLSMLDNTGRRNILMSASQEEFFSQALSKTYTGVINNGRTGEPDIVVGELGRELECKITSPSSTGSICLQTDYATLQKKESLDYLYVVADRLFKKFVVLHYTGLTPDDFSVPCSSGRGKSKMIKHVSHSKCRVLWGAVSDKGKKQLETLQVRLEKCSPQAVKKREKILQSIEYWNTSPTSFTYEFEEA